jgi:hypothetical protein
MAKHLTKNDISTGNYEIGDFYIRPAKNGNGEETNTLTAIRNTKSRVMLTFVFQYNRPTKEYNGETQTSTCTSKQIIEYFESLGIK